MPTTEEDVREMIGLLDRYRYEIEMFTQQLNLLMATETELAAAGEFLGSYDSIEEGSEVLVPVGGNVMVPAKVTNTDKVIATLGADLQAEMDPKAAAERIAERRDRVRDMIQQVRAGIEQRETSSAALQQQAEAAYTELQNVKGQPTI